MMADQASHESMLSKTTIEGSRYASLRGAELAEALADIVRGQKPSDLSAFKTLNLGSRYLGRSGAEILGKCLLSGHLSNLEMLDLSGNNVGHVGLVALAEGFKAGHSRNLKILNLSENNVGDAGLVALAECFQAGHLGILEGLYLYESNVGHAGLVALAKGFKGGHSRNLKILDLYENNVGDEGLVALAECFQAGHLGNLEELHLGQNKVGEAGVVALAEGFKAGHLTNLKILTLDGNNVGNNGLVALAECFQAGHLGNLEELHLGQNKVGEAGVVALAEGLKASHSRNLKILTLDGNNVGNNGLVALAECFQAGHLGNLEELHLGQNKVGEAGVVALAEGLKASHSRNLKILTLDGNNVGNNGLVALVECFQAGHLGNLEELHLGQNKVGEAGVVALAEGFKAGHLTNLKLLNLNSNQVGEAGLVALAECFQAGHLGNLEELYLGQNKVGEAGVVALAEGFKAGHLTNFKKLILSENEAGDAGLVALAECFQAGHLGNLEELYVHQNKVGEAGVVALAEGFKAGHLTNFKKLILSENEAGDAGLVALAECFQAGHLGNLEQLSLAQNKVGEAGVVALAEGFKAGHSTNFKGLLLSGNEARDAGLVALAECFQVGHFSNLTVLDLSWNKVGEAGVVALAEGFKAGHLTNFKGLLLSGNEARDAGLVALAECFQVGHFSNLTVLDLSWNKVGEAGVVALAKGLKASHSRNLKTLALSGNNVGGNGLVALAECFQAGHLGNLEALYLHQNKVGEAGVVALAKGLKASHSRNLKILTLSGNNVGDNGLVALAECFQAGHLGNLEELFLGKNKVGDAGLEALVKSLQKSSSKSIRLKRVYLDSNLGFGDAILKLAGALEAGYLQSLTDLRLGRASQVARRAIVSVYETNRTLVLNLSFEPSDSAEGRALVKLRNRNLEWIQTLRVLEGEDNVSGTNGKVFFCGNAEVGKTTLKETLARKGWRAIPIIEKNLGKDPQRTRGIEVSQMIVSKDKGSPDKQSLMLSLWDLAGQPDYDVLHSAFLPDLALGDGQATFFVIVCSANRLLTSSVESAEDDLHYWLRFISSHSRETGDQHSKRKVLVVLNCFKGDRSRHDQKEWQGILVKCTKKFEKFVNIHQMPFIVDVRRANEVNSLKSQLKMQAKEMLQKRCMPAVCRSVQDTCREWAKQLKDYPVLSWQQYSLRLFNDSISKEKLEAATAYLHGAGELILFGKGTLTQGGLEDVTLVILSPEWFCRNVVGNLLLPESMAHANENPLSRKVEPDGSLLMSTLQEKLIIPKDKVEEVVAILLRLGLCYLADPMPEKKIFVPALIKTADEPQWPNGASIGNQNSAWVMGFSLVLEDSSRTLIPIALLRKLQVELAQDKDIGRRRDCKLTARQSFITFRCEGHDVLVEFSSNGINSEDRPAKTENSTEDRLDILVTPLQLVDEANSASAREEQVNLAQRIVHRVMEISTQCPGVKLVRKIIEPWNVAAGWQSITQRNTSTSVEDVIARVKENGLGDMNWTVGGELVKEEELLSKGDLEDVRFFAESRRDVIEKAVETLDLFNITDNPVESNVDPDDRVESNVAPNDQTRIIMGGLEKIGRESEKRDQITHEKLDEVNNNVKDVKASLHKALKQQKDIIHRVLCLERFTIGNAESSVPRYAYLTEAGKPNGWVDSWKSTLTSLHLHTITIHFLCEAPASNHKLHEVDGQVGVDVKRLKDWAQKLAPVLDWSLKIAFVTATIAGSAILPGLGVCFPNLPNVFTNASKLTSGIASLLERTSTSYSSADEHQSVSDSQADMLGQLSNKAKVPTLHHGEELRGVARKAVKELLDQLNPQEFKQQVGLTRARILNPAYGDADHVVWICDKCLGKYGNRAREIF